jgi:hypothetical protein
MPTRPATFLVQRSRRRPGTGRRPRRRWRGASPDQPRDIADLLTEANLRPANGVLYLNKRAESLDHQAISARLERSHNTGVTVSELGRGLLSGVSATPISEPGPPSHASGEKLYRQLAQQPAANDRVLAPLKPHERELLATCWCASPRETPPGPRPRWRLSQGRARHLPSNVGVRYVKNIPSCLGTLAAGAAATMCLSAAPVCRSMAPTNSPPDRAAWTRQCT